MDICTQLCYVHWHYVVTVSISGTDSEVEQLHVLEIWVTGWFKITDNGRIWYIVYTFLSVCRYKYSSILYTFELIKECRDLEESLKVTGNDTIW